MTDALENKNLPKMTLPVFPGDEISIPEDFKGQWTILYFYPKDDTPGCTKQACGYTDQYAKFKKAGVKLFGVSMDDLKSHEKFQKKFSLSFPLISDPDHKLADALGVYGEKSMYGKKYFGLNRDTFLIDSKGKIRKVWRKVKPEETVNETYNTVMEFKNKE